jgi:hypothetical protein
MPGDGHLFRAVAKISRWQSQRPISHLRVVSFESVIGWFELPGLLSCSKQREHDMRKFHSIAALCGDGLRPELQALFDRLEIDPHSELIIRRDGMTQSGPDPVAETDVPVAPRRVA